MMAGVTHVSANGLCYFITTVTKDRRRLFCDPENCRILIKVINNLRYSGQFLLAGFTVMPDHLHLAMSPTGSSVPSIVKEIKRGSARLINMRMGTAGPIWQEDYWDRGIGREDELLQKLEYMMANPYRANLVRSDETYSWGTGDPSFETDLDAILST